MKYPNPLLKGRLVQRYKRFLADVILEDGRSVTAHCANPGSMMGLKDPDMTVWLSPSTNPKRKLKYSWELVQVHTNDPASLVGVHTNITNTLAEEAITSGVVKELTGYDTLKREVKYGEKSRIDFLLSDNKKEDCYVEVKSVTLMRHAPLAEFPDAKTVRGTKHLMELTSMVSQGKRAVMLYIIQRQDAQNFALCKDIDPDYAQAFEVARKAGVEMLCYHCALSSTQIKVIKATPFQ